MENYDLVVVGGGPAGVVAATQAGRAGARTLLLEKSSRLGGTTINAGINRPGLFHAWGRQIIAAIGWELVDRTIKESGGEIPDFTDASVPFWAHQPFVDPMVYACLCDQFVLDAGCELSLHTMPAEVTEQENGWVMRICGKEGLRTLKARQLIDCTGDANVVEMAGYPLRIHESTQPATLDCELAGYDFDSLDLVAINEAFREAVRLGEVKASDGTWNIDEPQATWFLKNYGRNANHVVVPTNAQDSAGRTALEVEGRRSVYRMVRFLKRQPRLKDVCVIRMSVEVGVRETATIQGKSTVTLEDYQSGRLWNDAICYSFYPIDLHGIDAASWEARPLDHGVVGTVPRGALLPSNSRNLLVAGRCFSSDRYANSAMRVQASCMAMGQAAGALAYLAANSDSDPEHVPLTKLRALLRKHQAIVPRASSHRESEKTKTLLEPSYRWSAGCAVSNHQSLPPPSTSMPSRRLLPAAVPSATRFSPTNDSPVHLVTGYGPLRCPRCAAQMERCGRRRSWCGPCCWKVDSHQRFFGLKEMVARGDIAVGIDGGISPANVAEISAPGRNVIVSGWAYTRGRSNRRERGTHVRSHNVVPARCDRLCAMSTIEFARYPSLAGRVVFVTGGASGIGAEIVRQFAAQGSRVALVDNDTDAANQLIGVLEGEAPKGPVFFALDLRDVGALQGAIAETADVLGPVTTLVNNAGNDERHSVEEVTVDVWEDRLSVNLHHQFFAAQAVTPMMRQAGGGSVVNIGSISAHVGLNDLSAYATANGGIEGLTRSLARDLGADAIRVICVVPGWILTKRRRDLWLTPEAESRLMELQCLPVLLDPSDVARLVLWLAADDSMHCTGQLWVVGGGWM